MFWLACSTPCNKLEILPTHVPHQWSPADIRAQMPIQEDVDTTVRTQNTIDKCSCGIQAAFRKHAKLGQKFRSQYDQVSQQSLDNIVYILVLNIM